jgi:hypothetical protein
MISFPFTVPRWTNDLEICSELVNNLFEALANSARMYLVDVPKEPPTIPTPEPEQTAEPRTNYDNCRCSIEIPYSWKLDRLRGGTPQARQTARALDGWGE